MSEVQRVPVCHIQHDFEVSISEEGENGRFYINVDKSLNEVKEFTVAVSEEGTKFDISDGNGFQRVDRHLYSARLDGNEYRFRTMDEDYTGAAAPDEDIEWTAIDAINVPKLRYALGDSKGNCRVYGGTLQLERELKEAHRGEISSLKFFPSGEVVLSGSADMQLKLWSVLDGSCPRTFAGHRSAVSATCLIDRGRNFLSSSTDGTIRLWECGSGETLSVFSRREDSSDGVNCMCLRATCRGEASDMGENPLEFGTYGKHVLAGHSSGVMTLHDVFTKEQSSQIPSHFMSSCNTLTSDPKRDEYVYAGYQNGALAQWDLRNFSSPVSSVYINEGTPINHIYCESNELYVSSGLDTSLMLDLTADKGFIRSDLPTFLVSNDCKVAQYTSTPDRKHIIAVGDWGFCGKYGIHWRQTER
ncbi:hypothetical protein HG536_0D04340 [Torulaspora globosa]|uniref:Uncharacterized protein n=1 Tax=Torulaspora globosa TaxID=48254 RepID=A0A7G3ZHC6_9SACH|nr:uncharacterized protein HG536_0D04340 [Torulaspora globosa]QLL32912.1 hypothetical protein HG536_0D04340 [Torulaspora globosa]